MKKHILPLLFLIAIVVWQTHSLLRPGWFASHDGIYHIRRVGEFTEMLKAGYFPVRWGLTLDNYYGTPIFNYVYPGPYYLASFLTLLTPLGTPTILKLLAIGSFAGGGLAWYFFFKNKSRLWGVTAAILYLTTPYQLVNLFVRFSLGEIFVLGLLPWVLVVHEHLSQKNRLSWYAPLPLFFALISHNFLGLLGIGFLLIYSYFRFSHFGLITKNTLLSFLLASFFLLPMFFERSLVLSGAVKDFSFHLSDHFVTFSQLIYSRWDYWYSMPGTANDGMTFQLGFAQIAFVLISIFLIFRRRARSNLVLLVLYTLTIFLMLPISRWLWDFFPILQVVQFPWRLLGITALLTPLLVAHVKPTPIIIIAVLILGLINTRNYRLPMKFWTSEEFATEYALIKDKTATSIRGELVPRWAPTERWQNALITDSDVKLVLNPHSTQGTIIFQATAEYPDQAVTIQKNYFPSWYGSVEATKLPLTPTPDGSISVPLLLGTHLYTVKLGSTPLELIANFISLISFSYLFVLGYRHVS